MEIEQNEIVWNLIHKLKTDLGGIERYQSTIPVLPTNGVFFKLIENKYNSFQCFGFFIKHFQSQILIDNLICLIN